MLLTCKSLPLLKHSTFMYINPPLRQVLIELAPSYFRYMDSTANKPSVLAKLLGFFTVEIRNLETGTTQAKADLLVMENLFFNQNVSKTFDLKGIQGRKVKARAGSSVSNKTLFDGEWIEGEEMSSLDCCVSRLIYNVIGRPATCVDAYPCAFEVRPPRSYQERRRISRQEQHNGLFVRSQTCFTHFLAY